MLTENHVVSIQGKQLEPMILCIPHSVGNPKSDPIFIPVLETSLVMGHKFIESAEYFCLLPPVPSPLSLVISMTDMSQFPVIGF